MSPNIYNGPAQLLFSIPDVEERPSLISVLGAGVRGWPLKRSTLTGAPPNWLEEIVVEDWEHPLAGIALQENAVMVYAPRNMNATLFFSPAGEGRKNDRSFKHLIANPK